MAKMTPTVRGEVLIYYRDKHEQILTVGTVDWYTWLETASSFAFVSQAGSFTARREGRDMGVAIGTGAPTANSRVSSSRATWRSRYAFSHEKSL